MNMKANILFITWFMFLIFTLMNAQSIAIADGTDAVRAITGRHTRVVWIQEQGDQANGSGDSFLLMGLDTHDGIGERAILKDIDNYHKPLITPDGKRIVYSNLQKNKCYVVDYDGTNLHEVCDGQVADVWRDPDTGVTWIYVAYPLGKDKWGNVQRIQLDHPEIKETIWDKTPITVDNFQLSLDGKYASGQFPWPAMGIADLQNGTWNQLGKGCWSSMAPDNSYLGWVFDGPHRNVMISTFDGKNQWQVNINGAQAINGYEVYHPRWTNDVYYMTMTGPYMVGNRDNRIRGGGEGVEIFLAKFNENLRTIDYWAQVTQNNKADFFPDAWIEGGEKVAFAGFVEETNQVKSVKEIQWPGTNNGLVFMWEDASKDNKIFDGIKGFLENRVEAHGQAKYGRHYGMDVTNGYFTCEGVEDRMLEAFKTSNQLTIEMVIETDQNDQQGPARIVSYSKSSSSRNFTIGQDGDNLVMRLRTPQTGPNGSSPQVEICSLIPGEAQHIIVTYVPGMMVSYVNGKSVNTIVDVKGDFSNWEPQKLIFGAEVGSDRNWNGRIEGIAIYDRAMDSEEAAHHYELYHEKIKSRKSVDEYVVDAICDERSDIPDPKAIAPYLRALVVNKYSVEKIEKGNIREKEILIAHWAIMDNERVSNAAVEVGEKRRWRLEKFDDHPELEGERMVTDILDFDLPLFYSVN